MAKQETKNIVDLDVPKHVLSVAETLHNAGFDAYIIGGCVRGMIMKYPVADWDFTTNATPEQIQDLFDHTVYENDYGTVGVVFDDIKDPAQNLIEVTPYRKETGYSDNRRPDAVMFGVSLEEDLSRRDFTINALAYNPITKELVDLHNGIADLHNGHIRAVGNPEERFNEDALRMMRAVRIATQLNGSIEEKTGEAIRKHADSLAVIAVERVRDEFVKILMADKPAEGIFLLKEIGLMRHIIPELLRGVSIEQNQAHKYDVFEHNVRTLEHARVKELSLELRLAALLHDISKPETREWSNEKQDWTFYTHEVVGARVARKILRRMRFSKDIVDMASLLVRWHMFFSDTEQVTAAGVRRMVARVGAQNIWDLIDLRMCDRIGTGRPKEQPYRLRKYTAMVEEVLREPITPGTLVIDGSMLMKELDMKPGPRIGYMLHTLLAEVLEDPTKNEKEVLFVRAKELSQMPDEKLAALGEKGKVRRMEEEQEEIMSIRKKHGVR